MAVKLGPLVEEGVLAIENEHVRFVDRSMDDVPAVTGDVVTRALEAMLDFVDQHRSDSAGAGQVPNALALFNVAHASTRQHPDQHTPVGEPDPCDRSDAALFEHFEREGRPPL